MKKKRKLQLSRETLRNLVPNHLQNVGGGGAGLTCGGDSACDCSGGQGSDFLCNTTTGNDGTHFCTLDQR